MRVLTLVLAAGFALLCFEGRASAQRSLPPAKFSAVARGIVRVRAQDCGGAERNGTGFFINGNGEIVTARHLVAGCARVSVYPTTADGVVGGTLTPAAVRKMRTRADLALLYAQIPNSRSLTLAAQAARPGAALAEVGYFLDSNGVYDLPVSVKNGSPLLSVLVPPSMQSSLTTAQSPSLTLPVLALSAALLPGCSGSPIVDAQSGQVVGMADGGLNNGTVGVSWGIPADEIRYLLEQPSDPVPPQGQSSASSLLFSDEVSLQSGPEIRCNGFSFTKVRTNVHFADIGPYGDDQAGLSNLLNTIGTELANTYYDVYYSIASGAAIVAPAGLTFQTTTRGCTARSRGGFVTFQIYAQHVPTAGAWNAPEAAFRANFLKTADWQAAIGPQNNNGPRPDGSIVLRQILMRPANYVTGLPRAEDTAAFVELARGKTFIGYSVLFKTGRHDFFDTTGPCWNPDESSVPEGCLNLRKDAGFFTWGEVSTYLTTFSSVLAN